MLWRRFMKRLYNFKGKILFLVNRQYRDVTRKNNSLSLKPETKSSGIFITFATEFKTKNMQPLVSIIMGSTSDLPVMEAACKFFDSQEIPFEMLALSAHRTPDEVAEYAKNAHQRGIKVIIAGAGMAAHLPGVIAAMTPLPVIGVPIKSSLEGMDAALAMLQMPPGIPVATVAINGAQNAAILALQMLSVNNPEMLDKVLAFKQNLKQKIVKANADLSEISYKFKTN